MAKENTQSESKSAPHPPEELSKPVPSQNSVAEELTPVDIEVLPKSDIFGLPHRFNIMMILYNYERIGFTALRKTLNLTSGNLEHHMQKLIKLGWVHPFFVFSFRPLQYYKITKAGREEFKDHALKLRKILESL